MQAGHEPPTEPGYRAQTGAGSGPFGSEVGFTTRLATALEARLRAAGVDARHTPGQVTPRAAPGAVFVSLHHDAPEGAALVGHAVTGVNENYYEGEGFGSPSPVPLPTSAPHRPATTVSPAVERRSRALARRLAAALGAIRTPGNGAAAPFAGVADGANPRVNRYHGFYRTEADARVIVEAGAGRTDDAFLARVDLIADALAPAILEHLAEVAESGSIPPWRTA